MTFHIEGNAGLLHIFDTIVAIEKGDDDKVCLEILQAVTSEWGTDKAEIMDSTPAQRACRSLLVSQVKTYIALLSSRPPESAEWREIFAKLRSTVRAALYPTTEIV